MSDTHASVNPTGPFRVEPVRILFVNYHGSIGGGQVQMLTVLDGLNRQYLHPVVVCCQEGPFMDALRQRGIETYMIPFGKGKFRYLHVTLPAIWKFYTLLKRLRVGLVQVIGLQEAKLAAWACRLLRVPLIWVVQP